MPAVKRTIQKNSNNKKDRNSCLGIYTQSQHFKTCVIDVLNNQIYIKCYDICVRQTVCVTYLTACIIEVGSSSSMCFASSFCKKKRQVCSSFKSLNRPEFNRTGFN